MQPLEDKSNSADEGVNISSISSPFDTKLSVNRPGNPTPAEAASGDSGLGNHREMQNRSRPFNPTPHQASKSNHRMYDVPINESINEIAETQYAGADLEANDLGNQEQITMEEANFSTKQNQQYQNFEGTITLSQVSLPILLNLCYSSSFNLQPAMYGKSYLLLPSQIPTIVFIHI